MGREADIQFKFYSGLTEVPFGEIILKLTITAKVGCRGVINNHLKFLNLSSPDAKLINPIDK